MDSIRCRLLLSLAAVILVAWASLSVVVYQEASHEIEEVFDAHLAQYARVLQLLVARAGPDRTARTEALPFIAELDVAIGSYLDARPLAGHRYERKLMFQVWGTDGELLLRSPNAPLVLLAPRASGYGIEQWADHAWRTFSLGADGEGLRVQVAERDDVRGELVEQIVVQQLAPGLVIVPVLAILVLAVVGQGLAPLHRFAAEVARRNPDQLDPLKERAAPQEIRPLAEALNRLFLRLRHALERERRFTADAAHELRTPLAAIRTQAEVALGSADENVRRRALENIVRGVTRASRVEEQLLTLARLEPEARSPLKASRADLVKLSREVLAELAPLAMARQVELSLEGAAAAPATADPALVEVMLRNLVENAIRYAGAGSVRVEIKPEAGAVEIVVDDSGPGIPAAERERVFDRFYRLPGTESHGSGLGLSIVRRIAELHGATVSLEDAPTGGLRVRARLPRGPLAG